MKLFTEDCFLTEEANEVVSQFEELGMDRDLAIALVIKVWPEQKVWEIPDAARNA